jgi:hypothetical protein
MRRFLLPPLLMAILLLAGCPFSSDAPLSDPGSAVVDTALAGAWKVQDPDTGEVRIVSFKAFNEHELVGMTPGDAKDSIDAFRLFTTEIGTERFLNVQELGVDDTAWYLVRYRLDAGTLVMSVVDDTLFNGKSFATSAQLQDFLRQNLADPRLYAASGETRQDMVWERAGEASY